MIIRGDITKQKLHIIYKTIHKIYPIEEYQHLYYTSKELEELKDNKIYKDLKNKGE